MLAFAVAGLLASKGGAHAHTPVCTGPSINFAGRTAAPSDHHRRGPSRARLEALGFVAAAAALAAGAVRLATRPPPLHGAARFAREGELRRAGLRARAGIALGRMGAGLGGRYLVDGGPEHVLVCAPTRSGKGVGLVIPNLLTWPGSVVVLDIKRENWTASAGYRAACGQTVILFDPLDPEGRTARFNPFGHIDRTDPTGVADELQKIAVMLFPAPAGADAFWAEAARTGFIGVAAALAATPEAAFDIGAVHAALACADARERLLTLVREREASDSPLPSACARALLDLCGASENTFASIRQTLTSRLGLWLNPRVCAATAASDFSVEDLRGQAVSLYLCVSPSNLERIAPLYGLILQQIVDLNTRVLPGPKDSRPAALIVLDEFSRLGHVGVLARAFAFVAGYGIRLMPVIQSAAQLRAEYGPDLAGDILANCGIEVCFAPNSLGAARDLAERIGAWTYRARSVSRPRGLARGAASATESAQRRLLMLPQELLRMDPRDLVILKNGAPPVKARKIVYWRERTFSARIRPAPSVPPRAETPAAAADPFGASRARASAQPRAHGATTLERRLLESFGPARAPRSERRDSRNET